MKKVGKPKKTRTLTVAKNVAEIFMAGFVVDVC